MQPRMNARPVFRTVLIALLMCQVSAGEEGSVLSGLSVAAFLPHQFVRDGSVSYHGELQRAIDTAAASGQTLRFPAMIYAVDQTGLKLHSGMTIDMRVVGDLDIESYEPISEGTHRWEEESRELYYHICAPVPELLGAFVLSTTAVRGSSWGRVKALWR